jgi:hypothetical protein
MYPNIPGGLVRARPPVASPDATPADGASGTSEIGGGIEVLDPRGEPVAIREIDAARGCKEVLVGLQLVHGADGKSAT